MLRKRVNRIAALVAFAIAIDVGWRLVEWGFVHAIWRVPGGDSAACRAIKGRGACWAVVTERCRYLLLGPNPSGAGWRPLVVCGMFAALFAASTVRRWWTPRLLACWMAVPAAAALLMPADSWGGLPLTLEISTAGFMLAFPLAVLLALGRRSRLPVVRSMCVAAIEIVRGVPLVTFLFMATVLFPLFTPAGFVVDKLLRATLAFAMAIAAYEAEVVGAGLDAVPAGQLDAAASLGLSCWSATLLVALPQALRATLPATVNTFVAFFKDTTLVAVIGLFDLLGAANSVIADAAWVGFGVEVYLFVSLVYGALCWTVAWYGRHVERAFAAEAA